MNIGELIAYLKLDKSGFDSGIDEVQKKTKAVGETMKDIGSKMSTFLTAPLVAFAGFSIKAWTESQNAITKLGGVLKSTGNVIGYTTDQLEEFASQIQETTGFEDDMVVNAEAVLATFTSIGHDVFPQAIKAAADMSAVMGQDLQGSVVQLGKALQDPITGLTALRRVGVNFNETQKETIKQFVQMGDITSAQNVILKELNKEFGNVAEAMMQTDTGALKALGNDFGNLQEDVGRLLLEALRPLIDGARQLIKWFMGLDEGTKKVIITIGGVTAAVGPLMVVIGTLFKLISTNPVGLVITGLVALTAGIVTAFSTFRSEKQKAEDDMKAFNEFSAAAAATMAERVIATRKKEFEEGAKTEEQIMKAARKNLESANKIYLENYSSDNKAFYEDYKANLKIVNDLESYFVAKKDEKRNKDTLANQNWLKEQTKAVEEFAKIRLSDVEREKKEIKDRYNYYTYYKVRPQKEIDEWYAKEKAKIDEKYRKEEIDGLAEQRKAYQKFVDKGHEITEESTKKTQEETEKQKKFWQDLADSISTMWGSVGNVMSAYFAYANSELENQYTIQQQAAEDFEDANRTDFESSLYRLNLEKEKYIAAGIDKNKIDQWYQKQLNKLKEKASDEELLRIDEITATQEAQAKEDYARTRDIAMKKYQLEVDAFNWNKGVQAVNILISTAQSIMKAYASLDPISASIVAGIYGVLGGIQEGFVLAQQPPPPPAFQYGGWVGGMSGIDKNTIRATRGEYVVNAEAAKANAETLEAINNGASGGSFITIEPATINIMLSDGRIIGRADIEFIEKESSRGGLRISPKAIVSNI